MIHRNLLHNSTREQQPFPASEVRPSPEHKEDLRATTCSNADSRTSNQPTKIPAFQARQSGMGSPKRREIFDSQKTYICKIKSEEQG
jgi:hypothetical protein